jgi:hypothetical protein
VVGSTVASPARRQIKRSYLVERRVARYSEARGYPLTLSLSFQNGVAGRCLPDSTTCRKRSRLGWEFTGESGPSSCNPILIHVKYDNLKGGHGNLNRANP